MLLVHLIHKTILNTNKCREWLKIYGMYRLKKTAADAAWKNYAPNKKKHSNFEKLFTQKKDNDSTRR